MLEVLGNREPPPRQRIPQNSHSCLRSIAAVKIPLKIPRSGSWSGSAAKSNEESKEFVENFYSYQQLHICCNSKKNSSEKKSRMPIIIRIITKINSFVANHTSHPFEKNSSKFVDNFLSYHADEQTNKRKKITSSTEVTWRQGNGLCFR